MYNIISEFSDVRQDNRILKINQGDSFVLPVKFTIHTKGIHNEDIDINIPEKWKIRVEIKRDPRFVNNILEFEYTNIKNNIVYIEFKGEDTMLLRDGVDYVLKAKLYDENDEMCYDLIHNMKIKVG
jgi:hypothetical protein